MRILKQCSFRYELSRKISHHSDSFGEALLEIIPDVYQMQAMIFGAKSSPTSANYCLKRTAIVNQDTSSKETTSTVLRDFYMDDLLKSSSSEDDTAELALQLIELLARGSF